MRWSAAKCPSQTLTRIPTELRYVEMRHFWAIFKLRATARPKFKCATFTSGVPRPFREGEGGRRCSGAKFPTSKLVSAGGEDFRNITYQYRPNQFYRSIYRPFPINLPTCNIFPT
jgi:hypothetical protein